MPSLSNSMPTLSMHTSLSVIPSTPSSFTLSKNYRPVGVQKQETNQLSYLAVTWGRRGKEEKDWTIKSLGEIYLFSLTIKVSLTAISRRLLSNLDAFLLF